MRTKVLKKSVLILLVFCIGLSSCNDDPPEPSDNNEEKIPLIFESLTAEKDTIVSGETVVITAIASGKDIRYNWTATTGSILGSGHEITLTTTPCVPEEITVTCKVEDTYNESKTKTVLIVTL